MSRFWKKEQYNHHFPELNSRGKTFRFFCKFFSEKKIAVILTVLVFSVGFVYLTQTNVTATQGYEIKELEKNIQDLEEANTKLNLEYIEMQSMASIIERVPDLNLVAIDNVEVIGAMDSVVALR